MAAKRCVPTNLFDNPDFFELGSDTQVVLLGLVLNADDHGRGVAHSKVLARKFDKARPIIEQALQELEANRFILCYEVEQQLYYSLCIWRKWQTLSKPTPSKYPAPPTTEQDNPLVVASSTDVSEQVPRTPQDFQGEENLFQGNPGKSSLEGEEEEEEELEPKGEGEESPSKKVITFPVSASLGTGTTGGKTVEKNTTISEITTQLASILKLPTSDGLYRLASEYCNDPSLSVLSEADAAREWIDGPKNREQEQQQKQQMSLRFFHRWLRREREDGMVRQKQREQQATTGTVGPGKKAAAPPAHNSLMNLSAQYRQHTTHQGSTEKEIQHG